VRVWLAKGTQKMLRYHWWCFLLFFPLFWYSYHNIQVFLFSYIKFHIGLKQWKFYEDVIFHSFVFSVRSTIYLIFSTYLGRLTYTLFICMTSQFPNFNVILTCMNHCGGALNNSICYLYLIKIYIEIIQSLDTLLEQSVMDLDKRPAAICDSSVKASMKAKIICNWSCT